MASSQNGFRANDRSVVSTRNVPGTSVRLAVRNGSPGDLLLEVAARFHREVESIEGVADDWGYAERNIRGSSTTLSNHASGTAIDLNATRHPLAKRGTFTADQARRIRAIVGATGGAVRWGGDYSGRADEMHFEVNDGRTVEQCTAALARLRGSSPAPTPSAPDAAGGSVLQKGSTGPKVRELQHVLNAWYPWLHLVEDGVYGDATEAGVRELQRRAGLEVDGIAGPNTLGALRIA